MTTPPTPQETWEALKVKHNPLCTLLEGNLYFREDEVIKMIDDALSSSHTALVEKVDGKIGEKGDANFEEDNYAAGYNDACHEIKDDILKLIQDSV